MIKLVLVLEIYYVEFLNIEKTNIKILKLDLKNNLESKVILFFIV